MKEKQFQNKTIDIRNRKYSADGGLKRCTVNTALLSIIIENKVNTKFYERYKMRDAQKGIS